MIKKPRIASKTPDKDRQRYHYCKEIGYFIRECRKKDQDQRRQSAYRLYDIAKEIEPAEDSSFDPFTDFEIEGQTQYDNLNH